MTIWTEVQAGDMQRQAENAYMFRRTLSKDGNWAMLCTHVGEARTFPDVDEFECYGRDTNAVEYYTMSITLAEWEALTQDMVGVSDEEPEVDEEPTSPPVNVDVPYVAQEGTSLTCTMGNWDNTPSEYHYAWMIDGTEADGADSPTYTIQPSDVGALAHCIVSAGNALGVTEAPPSNEVTITE